CAATLPAIQYLQDQDGSWARPAAGHPDVAPALLQSLAVCATRRKAMLLAHQNLQTQLGPAFQINALHAQILEHRCAPMLSSPPNARFPQEQTLIPGSHSSGAYAGAPPPRHCLARCRRKEFPAAWTSLSHSARSAQCGRLQKW